MEHGRWRWAGIFDELSISFVYSLSSRNLQTSHPHCFVSRIKSKANKTEMHQNIVRERSGTCSETLLGAVHTNPFSNENGAVLLRIRLSSTLQRRKQSPKTEPFENTLQSGAIWKRRFLKTLFSGVDGENDAIWKRWRHQNRNDWASDNSIVSTQNGGQMLLCAPRV